MHVVHVMEETKEAVVAAGITKTFLIVMDSTAKFTKEILFGATMLKTMKRTVCSVSFEKDSCIVSYSYDYL